jgi:PAS domain S-box-containing protein
MTRSFTPQQVVLLLGTALVIASLMVFVVYALHKAMKRERRQMIASLRPPRSIDQSAFMIASLQGVVAKMKARENELEILLRDAEQRAETSTRTLEAIVREMPQGLMVFDAAGFLTLANPAARALLEADTWSRRRYSDIVRSDSPLALRIRRCLENGKSCRHETVEYTSPSGRVRRLDVSLSPYQGRGGQLAGAICIIANLPDGKS